jgi:hypothetical protein
MHILTKDIKDVHRIRLAYSWGGERGREREREKIFCSEPNFIYRISLDL